MTMTEQMMKMMKRLGAGLLCMLLATSAVSGQDRARVAERLAQRTLERAQVEAHLSRQQAVLARERAEVALSMHAHESFRTNAPAPWAQQEDAASRAYAAAREALNGRQYQAAMEQFAMLRDRYPESVYVAESYYWQAFALYRAGGQDSYRRAAELLTYQRAEYPDARTRSDADELLVRLEDLLARRGDAAAAAQIARRAQEDPCGGQEAVRAAALHALLNMNAERAIPILREVLQRRDECSVELRRQAVFMLSQKMTDESVDILLDLAHRNPDPDPEVREQAVFWLSQVQGDEALDALESILRESEEAELQENAIFAISQHGSDRAVAILHEYAERADAPRELREHAIVWIAQSGGGGAEYLISLYDSLEDEELREHAIFGIAQADSEASRAWLMQRAMDPEEDVEVRKNALFFASQMGDLGLAELQSIYRSSPDPEIREHVVFVAGQSSEDGVVDFLMEVARDEDEPALREHAIFWLGQSEDPRVAEFLLSLIR